MSLDALRDRIDRLDERIVELLNERARCALTIGEIKQALGMQIYQPDRESQVLAHVRRHGAALGGPLGPEALTRLFERIIDEARRLERESAAEPQSEHATEAQRAQRDLNTDSATEAQSAQRDLDTNQATEAQRAQRDLSTADQATKAQRTQRDLSTDPATETRRAQRKRRAGGA